MGRYRKARETALQVLYRLDINGTLREHEKTSPAPQNTIRELLDLIAPNSEKLRNLATLIVKGILEHHAEIDAVIEASAENWTVDRISLVDRNILRIAVFELRYVPEIPYKVSINEAIEISKRFSTENAGSFINGVLDRVRRMIESRDIGADCNNVEGVFSL